MVRFVLSVLTAGTWSVCLALLAIIVELSYFHPAKAREGAGPLVIGLFITLLIALKATQELIDHERKHCLKCPDDKLEDDEWNPSV